MIYVTYHTSTVHTVKVKDILDLHKQGNAFWIYVVTKTGKADWWLGTNADETYDGIPDSIKVDNELYIGRDGIDRLWMKLTAKKQQLELIDALEEL